jgi:CheY-like chemotaxis protein
MSHELRTPLNSLLMLAEQLEDNPDDNMTSTQVGYASVILASGRDLLKLLNSILDLAKVESGTVTVEMTELVIGDLCTSLLRDFVHVAEGKGLTYAIDVAPGSPHEMFTDPQRLRQVLKNLLANAFKFTKRGEVQMRVALASGGWSPDTETLVNAPAVVAFSVRDTGVGIEHEQQQRIFEAFAQVDGATAREYGGTGLGLSISRALIGLLGGEITVTSARDQGSTFTVYLPLSRTAAAVRAGASTSEPLVPEYGDLSLAGNDLRTRATDVKPDRRVPTALDSFPFDGTKVLVVDDDFRNVFAMTALLERGHAAVLAAESGAEALSALEQTPDIDIVLLDIMMPGMDGYATVRAIRAIEQFKELPVIVVTGKVVPGERQRCLDAGANDFVTKPVDTTQLLAAIGPWLPTAALVGP